MKGFSIQMRYPGEVSGEGCRTDLETVGSHRMALDRGERVIKR